MQYNVKFEISAAESEYTNVSELINTRAIETACQLGMGICDKVGFSKKEEKENTQYDCSVVAYPLKEWVVFQQELRLQIHKNFATEDVPQLLNMFGVIFDGLEKGVFKNAKSRGRTLGGDHKSKIIVEP